MDAVTLALLTNILNLLRDGGLVVVGLAFIGAMYRGAIVWGKDLAKANLLTDKAVADLKSAQATILAQTATIQHQTEVMERSMWVNQHMVAGRIAFEEGIPENDVVARLAVSQKVGPNTQLNYPKVIGAIGSPGTGSSQPGQPKS